MSSDREARRYSLALCSRKKTMRRDTLELCKVCGRLWATGDSRGGRWRGCSQFCRETLRQRELLARSAPSAKGAQ